MRAIANVLSGAGTPAPSMDDLRPLLGRCHAFYPSLAAIADSTKAGLLLSRLWQWTRRTAPDATGAIWVQRTAGQLQAETGLSLREQGRVRAGLCARGLLETVRLGAPARMHYRLALDAIQGALIGLEDAADGGSIEALLGPPQPHYPRLSRLVGNLHAGLLLSRALHFIRHAEHPRERAGDVPADAVTAESLGLARRTWEGARRDLEAGGWWSERLFGVPARLVARVNLRALQDDLRQMDVAADALQIAENLPNKNVQNVTTRSHERCELVMTECTNQLYANVRTSCDETSDLLKKETNTYLKTTTTEAYPDPISASPGARGASLVLPDELTLAEQEPARLMVVDCGEMAQVLLDQLGARLRARAVRTNPLGYLHTLVAAHRQGRFVPGRMPQRDRHREQLAEESSRRQGLLDELERRRRETGTEAGQQRVNAQRAALAEIRSQIWRRPPDATRAAPL